MIDLFEINHYLQLMMKMYTGLKLSFHYNLKNDSCLFSCDYLRDPVYESCVWVFHVPDTQAAIARINCYVLDFLAKLASRRVSFREEDEK